MVEENSKGELFEIDYKPRFYEFHNLMKHRIENILLVSNAYTRFLLEEDGRIGDQILDEYLNLHLSNPPKLFGCTTSKQAINILQKEKIDIVITMQRIGQLDPYAFSLEIKKVSPRTPVVLLLTNRIDLKNLPLKKDQGGIDRIFFWSGDSKIFLAIVKMFEDLLNIEDDVKTGKIQAILLIENSPLYYSLFLPMLYSEVMKQTYRLIAEDTVNEYHRILRKRTRPKIILAESSEEALNYFKKYKSNLLGVLSDVAFPKTIHGEIDPNAGSDFIKLVREFDASMPTLMMSSQLENLKKAQILNSSFIYKNSPKALQFLKQFLAILGFGEFIFRTSDNKKVAHAKNLEELKNKLTKVPNDSILYHASNNHFSNWLMARGEFDIAYKVRPKKITDFNNTEDLRRYLINTIDTFKHDIQKGTIADFSESEMEYSTFTRIGQGSLGGKGRGIAFLEHLLSITKFNDSYENIDIRIPISITICTDEFDNFLENNNLYEKLNPDLSDEEIVKFFTRSTLNKRLKSKLKAWLSNFKMPIAVRSSSLLEDSQFQPFAGVYKTFMLPNNPKHNEKVRLRQLCKAIKLVYASMFLSFPRHYLENVATHIEQEKMGVVIQEIIGQKHGIHYYPDISGVTQSYNYYPFGRMEPEDGIAYIALGLGKIIVDGQNSFQFCPSYPEIQPQMSDIHQFLNLSQNFFYSLNLDADLDLDYAEDTNLLKNDLSTAEEHGILFKIGSVYDVESDVIRDGLSWNGPRVITFASILKYKIFPLAKIIQDLLKLGEKAFGNPVEIEFAVNLKTQDKIASFYLLQIRPFASGFIDSLKSNIIMKPEDPLTIAYSTKALGNGIIKTIKDIIYVNPEGFNKMDTNSIASEIRLINEEMKRKGKRKPYLLIGFGRWGSKDPYLGIPITNWNDISGAEAIIEASLPEFNIEPSFGSHFFANISGLNIPYFTISPSPSSDDVLNWDVITNPELKSEVISNCLVHVTLDFPLEIIVDGRSRKGIIKLSDGMNPKEGENSF